MISNFKFQISNSQKGFVVSAITFFVLIIMLSIALSMSSLVFYRQKISTYFVKSTQSYYAAEAGIEDALLKLNDNPNMASGSYNLTVGSLTATITVPDMAGGSRAILAKGDATGINRKIEAVYSIDAEGVGFNYGAQVGEGGLIMNNGSRVIGNVFSNGNVSGNGTIDENLIISGNGHNVQNTRVKGDALTYSCLANSVIEGDLTYVQGGAKTCTVQGSTSTQTAEIPAQSFPISNNQINDWKNEASANVINGSVTITNSQTKSYGPVKITGSLTVSNNATLNMTGTIWVQGDVSISNIGRVKLDSSYGSLGGILISDNIITLSNSAIVQGSGTSGSYLLIISTDSASPAISISNNAAGAVFYAPNGGITISNNTQLKGLTGYKITMQNNSIIQYETGLANAFFSSGPGGGWQVTSWKEK